MGNKGSVTAEVMYRCTVNLPFVLHIEDGAYPCVLGAKNQADMKVRLVDESREHKEGSGSLTVRPATGEMQVEGVLETTFDGARYTELTVAFLLRLIDEELREEHIQDLSEKARLFANAFLDSYRYYFGDSWVYPLSEGEFYAPRHGKGAQYFAKVSEGGKCKDLIGTKFAPSGLHMRSMPKYDQSRQKEFGAFLLTDSRPGLAHLLLLDAQRYFDRGQYRLAVIESATALDIEVESQAHKLLLKGGMSSADAGAKLERMFTTTTVEGILEPNLCGSLLQTRAWQRYDADFRSLRNRVVHDGYDPVRGEAEDCVQVFSSIIHDLRTRLGGTP